MMIGLGIENRSIPAAENEINDHEAVARTKISIKESDQEAGAETERRRKVENVTKVRIPKIFDNSNNFCNAFKYDNININYVEDHRDRDRKDEKTRSKHSSPRDESPKPRSSHSSSETKPSKSQSPKGSWEICSPPSIKSHKNGESTDEYNSRPTAEEEESA